MERIVVSGMGIISSIGIGVEQTWQSLLASRSGVGKLKYIKSKHQLPVAEVALSDAELRKLCGINVSTVLTRTTLLGIFATREAIAQAKLVFDNGKRIAFISGTTVGGMEKSENFYLDFLESNNHSEYISVHDCGSCSNQIAKLTGDFDLITTTSTACSSATNAMFLGANLLRTGIVDAVVAGGSECLTKFHLNGFNTLMILDKEPCRPFCATRSGLNLGEGAAYIVMELESSAVERTAAPIAVVSGYGNACDAYHQTASSPEGRGATLAMQEALKLAGISADKINYINAHGTATPNNDESEAQAIVNVFGKNIPLVSSTKAHTGHTTSAAGGVEAVISILAIHNSFVPETLNHQKDMESPIKIVKTPLKDQTLNYVMSNSFGFGGNNSSIIFGKCI
ncbi:MAG: beta-ketoacyl-[acyl-carrier-protein] synthase family protein [Bacteroidales bacterium]